MVCSGCCQLLPRRVPYPTCASDLYATAISDRSETAVDLRECDTWQQQLAALESQHAHALRYVCRPPRAQAAMCARISSAQHYVMTTPPCFGSYTAPAAGQYSYHSYGRCYIVWIAGGACQSDVHLTTQRQPPGCIGNQTNMLQCLTSGHSSAMSIIMRAVTSVLNGRFSPAWCVGCA